MWKIIYNIFVAISSLDKLNLLQVDPTTGEAEDDGVEDEYQLEDLEIVAADYVLKVGVSNFRNAWESLGPDFERVIWNIHGTLYYMLLRNFYNLYS